MALFPEDAGMNRIKKQAQSMTLERSTISASGGQADAAIWVKRLQSIHVHPAVS